MCLLVILNRVTEDAPVIVGANREEAYARGGTPPQLVAGPVPFVAGLDPKAGGTWLGVNGHGVLVAVTNRATRSPDPPQPRSRGLLARDLLACRTAVDASRQAAQEMSRTPYAGCNLLCADTESVYIIHSGDWLRVRPLPPGIYVLTKGELNDGTDARVMRALAWLERRSLTVSAQCVSGLKKLCALPGDAERPPICLHGERGGTVSSTIVVLRQPLSQRRYWHAQGPPDQTAYEDYSHLLQGVSGES